ncbi:Amidohydro-rel domain-containing protein [Pseudozyma hubeiensis]|nr:Amidohydro-rel domain-containing protein [Pseudozyma hubeiensis]
MDVVGWKGQERRDMARRVNEYVAELGRQHPGRFGNFATVPLPDVEGAITEAEYALDHLMADGIVVLSNYEDKYLGDSKYSPLWEKLNERGAVVFIHPGHPQIPTLEGVPGPLVDYPFDTTRNAVHMVFNGVLDKYPKLFYYDTALSSGAEAFPSLLAFVDHDHILFGSDFPYAPAPLATQFTQRLDTESGLNESQKVAINSLSATKLFG